MIKKEIIVILPALDVLWAIIIPFYRRIYHHRAEFDLQPDPVMIAG
jgi:hypothetical protein